LEEELEIAERK